MLAELADRLEEADKLTGCGTAFTSALLFQTQDEPQIRRLNLLFSTLPFSVFSFILILFNGLIEVKSQAVMPGCDNISNNNNSNNATTNNNNTFY